MSSRQRARHWAQCGLWKHQSPPSRTQLLQQGHTFYSFPNSSTQWAPNIQIYDSIGAILIKTTTRTQSYGVSLKPQRLKKAKAGGQGFGNFVRPCITIKITINKLINIKNIAEHLCSMYKVLRFNVSNHEKKEKKTKQIYGLWVYAEISGLFLQNHF